MILSSTETHLCSSSYAFRSASVSSSVSCCSNAPENGMIGAPGSFLSTHSLIFGSHLFFFRIKSLSDRLTISFSSSFSRSSSLMMDRSRTGSTSPSTGVEHLEEKEEKKKKKKKKKPKRNISANALSGAITPRWKDTLTAQMEDGIARTDVRQECVAETLPLGGTFHQPGNVDHVQNSQVEYANVNELEFCTK
uniref:Uncharacterized protein n=1 Tax=Anopheles merus TaxID=30066 RepID=A0A182VBA9_ANOME